MMYRAALLLTLTYLASAQNPPQSGHGQPAFVHHNHRVYPGYPGYPSGVIPGQPGSYFAHSHSIPCRPDPIQVRVNRTFVVFDRSVVCTGTLFMHRCNGACWTTYYLDPVTLAPRKDCDFCQPTSMAQQQANVIFTCNVDRFAPTTRPGVFSFVQPTACACQPC